MGLPNEVISGLLSSGKDEDSYQVSRSLRFNSADSAYLSRTQSGIATSTGLGRTWTFSVWFKRSAISTLQSIAGSQEAAGDQTGITVIQINASDNIDFYTYITGTGYNGRLITTQVFRDTSAWYHLVAVFDSSNATAGDRMRLYINGSEITSFSTDTNPTQNRQSSFLVSNISGNYVGARSTTAPAATEFHNGYLSNIHFIDGQALTPSSFAQSDANGRWVPKAFSGTYGTNGFYLNFSDNSGTTATTLGKDSSGNGNNWTPNNLSVTAGTGNDSFVDSPTNYGVDTGLGGVVRGNYATLNNTDAHSSATILNGSLQTYSASSAYHTVRCTQAMMSGKWYGEALVGGDWLGTFGIASTLPLITSFADAAFTSAYVILNNGAGTRATRSNNVDTNSRTADAANDIWQVAFDADTNKLWLGRNNTWYGGGNPSTGTTPTYTVTSGVIYAMMASGGNGSGQPMYLNFGQRPFAYTAPTGFKALCTTNLPTPTIKKPSQYMNIITYTGTGSTRSLTGVGFQPDCTLIKNRNSTEVYKLTDSVRGTSKSLSIQTTDDEVSESGVTSFDADGFTIGSATTGYNTNTNTYVGWNWKKGVTPGFDIVTYTGNGSNRTISHSLGAVPHFMIIKARTTAGTDQGWPAYHRNLTSAGYYILFNGAAVQVSDATVWNSTAPTSSVFSVGTSALTNTNNDTYVAYLWTEIPGFSRFGTYTGNDSTDGPFIWCGFRPKWTMIKPISGVNVYWILSDSIRNPYNIVDTGTLTGYGAAGDFVNSVVYKDYLSNGFKIRDSTQSQNSSSATYIFAAFAEAPFKYSRGR
jgi:hypothetical protein